MAEETNAFARILNRMSTADTGVTEKTAAAAPAPDAAARMLATVRSVSSSVKKEASAPAPSPRAALEKMAAEAQEAEEAQLLKQSHFMGAALADGFMERFAQYDAALSGVKTASAPDAATLEKVAQEAYLRGAQDMEKRAAAEFEQGYNEQMQQVHKIASDIHYIGQQTAQHLINEARKAP
jgi:hypothetical protein